jgi:AraC-like DNA-binding protein
MPNLSRSVPQERGNASECEPHVLAYKFAGKVDWAFETGTTEFSNSPRARRNRPTTRASKARNPAPKSVRGRALSLFSKLTPQNSANGPDGVRSISDLCRITKASERTLLRAFTERFGISPLDESASLNGARNDLAHEPSVKISDAANKWGFWHLGQFAKDYRNWFGELPSDTSHRHKSVGT